MGSGHSVELFADMDSPTEPGQKSIVSASMDDLDPPVTGQQFFEEMMSIIRTVDPITENVLKRIDVHEETPTKFTVKVILDGHKLDSYGYGKGDGTDRVKSWKKVTVDMPNLHAIVDDYVLDYMQGAWADEASDDKALFSTHLKVLKDPTRLEMYCLDTEGKRLSHEDLANALYPALDPVFSEIQAAAKAKVKLTPNAPSLKDKGQVSSVSEAMDEHVYYDGFFDSLVAVFKETSKSAPGAEIEDVSDTEFVSSQTVKDKDEKDKVIKHFVKFDKETGEIHVRLVDGGQERRQQYYLVHQSPLVLEAWTIGPDGQRSAGPSATRFLQKQVNQAIDKANSWFG